MSDRKLAEVRAEHAPSFRGRTLGRAPISNRPLKGWSVKCACGWSLRSNENKAYAESAWREHTRKVWAAERKDPTP